MLLCPWILQARILEWVVIEHKTSLSKFKKIEIIASIFSNHRAVRMEINYKKKKKEINYKKKTAKNTNKWRLKNMLLNKQWITEEIKGEIKITWRQMKIIQNMWDFPATAVLRRMFIVV